MDTTVAKYLRTFAEPTARELGAAVLATGERFDACVVVPVAGEALTALSGLDAALRAGLRVLPVVVVNAERGASAETLERNTLLLRHLEYSAQRRTQLREDAVLLGSSPSQCVLLLDWGGVARAFPPKTGVGLARKLGSDVALSLCSHGVVSSPWIYHCDADTTLPTTHFSRAMPEAGAVSFAFEHVAAGERDVDQATFEYETRLRYHRLGLQWADSPYAYHALGSSLAVHALSYAQVRGFPKRSAGEDFYLLDKVNKVSQVHCLPESPTRIAARRSRRVPFGTGAAVEKLVAGQPLMVDAPASYGVLASLQGALREVVETHEVGAFQAWQAAAPPNAVSSAAALGLGEALSSALDTTRGAADLSRRLHSWFDGLKTLRFLHGLRAGTPALPLARALREATFLPGVSGAAFADPGFDWQAVCMELRAADAKLQALRPCFGLGLPRDGVASLDRDGRVQE